MDYIIDNLYCFKVAYGRTSGHDLTLFLSFWQDTLHEHLSIMLSVHTALSDRASALLTVQTLMSDLASLQSRIEKLEAASSKIFGGDRARIRRVEELRETIRATEDAKFCALREYERIKVTKAHFIQKYCLLTMTRAITGEALTACSITPLASCNFSYLHVLFLMQNQFEVDSVCQLSNVCIFPLLFHNIIELWWISNIEKELVFID